MKLNMGQSRFPQSSSFLTINQQNKLNVRRIRTEIVRVKGVYEDDHKHGALKQKEMNLRISPTVKQVFKIKKWATPGLFFVYFWSFQININTILQQINVTKCPSSIWRWDLNPWPSKFESPPITTGPGSCQTGWKVTEHVLHIFWGCSKTNSLSLGLIQH